MDIKDFLAAKFDSELKEHFLKLADTGKIPLDLFRDKPNQEVLARYIMGEVAELLTKVKSPGTWLSLSVFTYMLHLLGAETAAELMSNAAEKKFDSPPGAEVWGVAEEDIGEPPRNAAPHVTYSGIKD